MFISRLILGNWRNFTKADVSLGETTYLLGPNASGKSNFLDVFRFLRDVASTDGGGLQKAMRDRGGLTKVRSLAARRDPVVKLKIHFQNKLDPSADPDWIYTLWIKSQVGGKRLPLIAKEEIHRSGKCLLSRPNSDDEGDPALLTQTHLEQINMNKEFRDISQFFNGVLYLHLVPQLLKFADSLSLPQQGTDPFGQGFLESVARSPKRTRNSRLRRIEVILKNVICNLEELRFVRDEASGRPHLEMRYNHWRNSGARQREDQFSDGTLRLIALSWVLMSSNNLVLLEEPELSLHSEIVRQIPRMIYEMRQSRRSPGGQVLVSTHSESMLSCQSMAGSFLVLKPGQSGEATTIEPPSKHDISAMRAGMSPADILLPQTAEYVGSL